MERTPDAVVFGLGDYLDFTRTTYRPVIAAAWGEDDKTHHQVDDMVQHSLVEPLGWSIRKYAPSMLPAHHRGTLRQAGKLVGLIEGNHFWRYQSGKTSTQALCDFLGVRYLGLSAWIRLTIYRSLGKQKRGAGNNLNLLLNHSVSSSGNLPASLAAATRKLQGWRGVDVFVTANDHQLGHSLEQQIGCTQRGQPRQVELQTIIGKAGSFQKGYTPGACSTSYVEKKFLHPSRLGYLAFDVHSYYRQLTKEERQMTGLSESPEVWRFSSFNV